MTEKQVVLHRDDPRWQRLHSIICEQSLQTGNFILSSGRQSKFIFQLRQTTLLPEGAALISDVILEYMRRNNISCVGGLALGAVPVISAVSLISHLQSTPVNAFFVRKKAKEHGALEQFAGHATIGGEVLLVDDVATSGNSITTALDGLIEKHLTCFVRKAFVVIDREEGASEYLQHHGIELVSIFKASDFIRSGDNFK